MQAESKYGRGACCCEYEQNKRNESGNWYTKENHMANNITIR